MYIQKYVNGQTGLTAYIYRIIYLQLKLWATLRNIKHISAEMSDYSVYEPWRNKQSTYCQCPYFCT